MIWNRERRTETEFVVGVESELYGTRSEEMIQRSFSVNPITDMGIEMVTEYYELCCGIFG